MARTVRNSKIENRTAREKLKPSGKPYYLALGNKLHLGYRKGKSGGKWVMRRYLGGEKYAVETIGAADDFDDADGAGILNFHQAQDRARERVKTLAEKERLATLGPAVTVRDVLGPYMAMRDEREARQRGGKGLRRNASSRLIKHVLGDEIADKLMGALTVNDLAGWARRLSGRVKAPARTIHDFRAAVYEGAKRHAAQLPPNIRDVIRDGLASVRDAPSGAREAQVLPDADVRRLIAAAWEVDTEGGWDGDLGRIVLTLAATGSRFSQIIRMTVADFQGAQKRLMVPTSRKGRGVKTSSHIGIRVGDDVLAALAKAIAGRKGHEPLFLRPHWRQGAVGRWEKAERGPWHSTDELTRLWPAIVARAGLAPGTVPYALRHSSIVRGLRAGLPVRLVAALHDTSTPMIEAHYAAFIVDAMDELAARAVVPLTTAPATVTPIAAVR